MNKMNIIVIGYRGTPIDEDHFVHLTSALCEMGVVADLKGIVVKAIDHDSIMKIIAQDVAKDLNLNPNISHKVDTAESDRLKEIEMTEGALVLIGTLFAEALKEGKETNNYGKFAFQLFMRCSDDAIAAAIERLATAHTSVSKRILQKYHFAPGAFEVIRDIYGSLSRFH